MWLCFLFSVGEVHPEPQIERRSSVMWVFVDHYVGITDRIWQGVAKGKLQETNCAV